VGVQALAAVWRVREAVLTAVLCAAAVLLLLLLLLLILGAPVLAVVPAAPEGNYGLFLNRSQNTKKNTEFQF
jgi:hypothetical protein